MTLREGRSLQSDHFHVDKAVRCRLFALLRRRQRREDVVVIRVYAPAGLSVRVWVTVVNIPTRESPYRVSPSPTVTVREHLAPRDPVPKARPGRGGRGDPRARPCPFNVYAEIIIAPHARNNFRRYYYYNILL